MENRDRRKFLKVLAGAAAGAVVAGEALGKSITQPEKDHKEQMVAGGESPYKFEAEAEPIVDQFLRNLNELREVRSFSAEGVLAGELAMHAEAYLDAYARSRAKHYGEHVVHRTPELDDQAFTLALVRGALAGIDARVGQALLDLYMERSELRVEKSLGKSGDSEQVLTDTGRDIG